MTDDPDTLGRRLSATRRRTRVTTPAPPDAGVGARDDDSVAEAVPDGARQAIDRLRRIEGQVRGLQRMILAGEDCEAILTQVMAARAALDRVAGQVVLENLEACFAARSPAASRQKAMRTIQLLARNA